MGRQRKFSERDTEFTRIALDLAEQGAGRVSPSPLVGCVIVSKDGNVAGEGFFVYDDVTHAEGLALRQAGEKATGGTAYISLEPHSHHGRTAPCTEALIDAGIARVVCPIEDPNPLVSGRGFRRLREAGVEVLTGIFAREAERQNEVFICWHRKKRPFVHLKSAVSLDGRIATRVGDSKWITGPESREAGRHLRHRYDAILIGAGTALADDPRLTDRSGLERRRKLVRVVLDDTLSLGADSSLVLTAREIPTIVITASADEQKGVALKQKGVEVVHIEEGARDAQNVLNELSRRELTSVLVEGGSTVAGSFLDAGLIDKVSFFIAPRLIGGNDAVPAIGGEGAEALSESLDLRDVSVTRRGQDVEITGYPSDR